MSAKASSAGWSDLRPSRSFEFLGRRRGAVGFHAAYKCAILEESGMANAGPGEPSAGLLRKSANRLAKPPWCGRCCVFRTGGRLGRPARKTQWISQGF
jgi:hypothetical protein